MIVLILVVEIVFWMFFKIITYIYKFLLIRMFPYYKHIYCFYIWRTCDISFHHMYLQ